MTRPRRCQLGLLAALSLGSLPIPPVAAEAPRVFWRSNQGEQVTSVRISSTTAFVVSGGYGGAAAARVWNTRNGELIREIPGHETGVISVDISPDESLLAVGHIRVDFYNAVAKTNVYDVATGDLLHEFGGAHTAFSSDGTRIACAGGAFNRDVRVFELPSGIEVADIYTGDYVYDMAFAADGNTVATCAGDDEVIMWDVNTGREIQRLSSGTGLGIGVLALSDDGSMIAGGATDQYEDASIHVWNVQPGDLMWTFDGHDNGVVYDLDFSPNGRTLLSTGRDIPVGSDTSARLWNVVTGEAVNVLQNMNAQYGPAKAVDDDSHTRWATDYGTDKAWLEVDLGSVTTIGRVKIIQESACSNRIKKFAIE